MCFFYQFYFSLHSFCHATLAADKKMLTVADTAYDIEKAMEASLTLLVQLVAITSGVIADGSNVAIPLVSGRTISLNQSKFSTIIFLKKVNITYLIVHVIREYK